MAVLTQAGITFADSTSQTTAATAAALVTTTNVLNATAGASSGAVGVYGFCVSNQDVATGNTTAGSNLRFCGIDGRNIGGGFQQTGGTPSGTWRLMGFQNRRSICGTIFIDGTLWLRTV